MLKKERGQESNKKGKGKEEGKKAIFLHKMMKKGNKRESNNIEEK